MVLVDPVDTGWGVGVGRVNWKLVRHPDYMYLIGLI
jgi:hypothetical protein